MTKREALLELAQQYSDFAKGLLNMSPDMFELNDRITTMVRTMIREIDVLLEQVKEEDDERGTKRYYH